MREKKIYIYNTNLLNTKKNYTICIVKNSVEKFSGMNIVPNNKLTITIFVILKVIHIVMYMFSKQYNNIYV